MGMGAPCLARATASVLIFAQVKPAKTKTEKNPKTEKKNYGKCKMLLELRK